MKYLDDKALNAIDSAAFLRVKPYPFINPEGLLTAEGFRNLIDNLPGIEVLEPFFGHQRSHGQLPHDRYNLEYTDSLSTVPVSACR